MESNIIFLQTVMHKKALIDTGVYV